MDRKQFSESVKNYRRPTGHSQQNLAGALGLHPTVLARKFSGTNNAQFSHAEIKQIVKTLAEWEAISLKSQALDLLSLMNLPATTFSNSEWAASPLAKLEKDSSANLLTYIEQPVINKQPATKAPISKLPIPLTQLIGRAGLVRLAIERLLQPEVKLLTLLGPGGIGKTRLSLEIGQQLLQQDKFQDGIYFIDLSNLTEASQVPNHLAQKLELALNPDGNMMMQLQSYLANRNLLLILDNFEHLEKAAILVSQLMEASPGLKLLVTSRIVLQIYGEAQLAVPPLDLPDLAELPTSADFADLLQIEAVRLFVARAQAVQSTFHLTEANYEDVARLCVLLEGLPLSLELAAARVKLLPLPYLLKQLSQSKLEAISSARGNRNLPPRQQTLRASISWSYSLLDEEAQQLFNCLGIFKGSFDLAAAEQICYGDKQPPADLLERLGNLVDQSLIKPVEAGSYEPRFVMLETLREFAILMLQKSNQFEELQARYCRYYLSLNERLTAEFSFDPEDRAGLTALLEQDFDNFQAAHYLSGLQVETETENKFSDKPRKWVQRKHSITIQRPVEDVFAYLCHFESWPCWHPFVKEIYELEPGPTRKGFPLRVVAMILGRRMEQASVISEYVENELLELDTIEGLYRLRLRFDFNAKGGQTTVNLTGTNNISQVFHIMQPVLIRILDRAIENICKGLADILEKEALIELKTDS